MSFAYFFSQKCQCCTMLKEGLYCFYCKSKYHYRISLVKLFYFQLGFLENCVYKKEKKSIKDQRNFCSNIFFKVFSNSVSVHSKIWFSRFSYFSYVYIWQLRWIAIHSKYKFFYINPLYCRKISFFSGSSSSFSSLSSWTSGLQILLSVLWIIGS